VRAVNITEIKRLAALLAGTALVAGLLGASSRPASAGEGMTIGQMLAPIWNWDEDGKPKPQPQAVPGSAVPPERPAVEPHGRVYLFRGALGPIFSRGMDRLSKEIEQAGVKANVYEFTICGLVSSQAVEDYRRDPAPIILIGHSMGGRCALLFSEKLQSEGIPVSLVVTIDPAHMSPDVPLNVERFINIYLSKDVLGGGNIVPTAGFQGQYVSYDLSQHDEISHVSIDKQDAIHEQLIAKILQIAGQSPKPQGDAVALRYVVPRNTPIELWDSGTAVTARSGDTLQTLASQFHVPLWSLTQINKWPDNVSLVAGQRVVVPRHVAERVPDWQPASSRR